MQLAVMTPDDIRRLSYVEFCALLDQPNIPPGGLESVRKVAQTCFLDRASLVLDPGCNTGYVSVELARMTGSRVVGLDVCPDMIKVAQQRQKDSPVWPGSVTFIHADATAMPLPEGIFDAVVCGGSTPFMDQPDRAISEFERVIRPWGYVADIEFYYKQEPRPNLLDEINLALGTRMPAFGREDWLRLYDQRDQLQRFFTADGDLEPMRLEPCREYVQEVVSSMDCSDDVRAAIRDRWLSLFDLFSENRRYLAYIIAVYRRLPESAWW